MSNKAAKHRLRSTEKAVEPQHDFPPLDGSLDHNQAVTWLDRPVLVKQIVDGLREVHAVVLTGHAGSGKNALAMQAAREFQVTARDGSKVQRFILSIGHRELTDAPNLMAGLVLAVRSQLEILPEFSKAVGQDWFQKPIKHASEGVQFLTHAGQILHKCNARVFVVLRSFHYVWWDGAIRDEFVRSNMQSGRLADLLYLLGTLQLPAKERTADWAASFYVIVACRNLEDWAFSVQSVSGFRPRLVKVPELGRVDTELILNAGWRGGLDQLDDGQQENVIQHCLWATAGLIQGVQAYGRIVGDALLNNHHSLDVDRIREVIRHPLDFESKLTSELLSQVRSFIPDNGKWPEFGEISPDAEDDQLWKPGDVIELVRSTSTSVKRIKLVDCPADRKLQFEVQRNELWLDVRLLSVMRRHLDASFPAADSDNRTPYTAHKKMLSGPTSAATNVQPPAGQQRRSPVTLTPEDVLDVITSDPVTEDQILSAFQYRLPHARLMQMLRSLESQRLVVRAPGYDVRMGRSTEYSWRLAR